MDHKIEDKKIIENKQTVENKKAIEKKCCREIMISVMALTLTTLLGGCGSNQDANGNSEITHSTTQSEVSGGEKEENKDDAEIPYVGAGRNIKEASSPIYRKVDGKTIAYVAASRAEKNRMTPQATDSDAGILRCYDNELFLQEIAEADANADYVVALAHWGTQYSYDLEEVQQTTGQEYIDAGADAVIGAHTHCLQGMEYYNGKPIIYSLGNYWFNEKTLDTMLLTLKITGNENKQETKVQIIPAVQSEHVTTAADTTEEKERIYSFLESISINVTIDEQGFVEEE